MILRHLITLCVLNKRNIFYIVLTVLHKTTPSELRNNSPLLYQLTLIVPRLAPLPMIIGHAIAHRRPLLHQTQRPIAARRILALLHFLLTIGARKSCRTSARIFRQSINANGSVLTGRRRTLVDVQLTVNALPSNCTRASVIQAMTLDAFSAV